jgi:transmembrane sensor
MSSMSFRNERVRMSIAEQAAEWFVANREDRLDAVQRGMFAAWLKTSPVHVEEYLGVALVARDLRQPAAHPGMSVDELVAYARGDDTNVRPIGTQVPGSSTRALSTRRRLPAFAGACAAAAVLAVVALAFVWWNRDQVTAIHYVTQHGEQATERLADNTVIRLNTDTAVTVRYDRRQRLVELERGQAFFEVAHEAGRPFRVTAGFADVRAVGTRFDVYKQSDSTMVTVVEGQVAVGLAPGQPGAGAAGGRTMAVRAGERLQVSQGSLPSTVVPADTRRGTAWLRREIVFEQEPLGMVVAEFNRYSGKPIEIETPELRTIQISGVFSADDTETFIAFLKSLDGVSVEVTNTRIRVSRM